jgi:hypothetical protein
MRIASVVKYISVLAVFILSTEGAFACQCGIGFREKNAWEKARRAEQSATVIFEGTPTKFELRWDLLDAKEGELIATDAFLGPSTERMPHMAVTFHVAKSYKGSLGADVQVHTGLGGGDCAAIYVPGMNYLVYAGGPSMDQLGTSMCSPGGWVEGEETATDLRYLRRERPTSTDLAPIVYWSQAGWDKQQEKQQRRFAESRQRFDAATGRICGSLIHDDPEDKGKGSIAFLSTLGYSPNSPPYAERKDDGSFCSPNLGPGTYFVYFVQQDDHGASALYYPGVADVTKATPIQVRAGQLAKVVFHVAKQPFYSVRGFISAEDRTAFDSELVDTAVVLIRSDGDRRVWYGAKTKFRLLPKLGYFKVDNVVPGRYFAFVQGRAGWMSRKVVVDVTTHSKLISLSLVRKK